MLYNIDQFIFEYCIGIVCQLLLSQEEADGTIRYVRSLQKAKHIATEQAWLEVSYLHLRTDRRREMLQQLYDVSISPTGSRVKMSEFHVFPFQVVSIICVMTLSARTERLL